MAVKEKFIIVLAVICMVGLVGRTAWNMHRQYNGVCVELGRPLTDEEKCRIAIKRLNARPTRSVRVGDSYVSYKKIPYENIDEFLEKNPNSCSVEVMEHWYNGDSSKWSRRFGIYAGHVRIDYTLNYIDGDEITLKTDDKVEYTIQNCGVIN
ncbi:MAG: hypothetical protein JKY51_09400 [Opitutaceae bacterium]|nr:hypothetical protein [Opitutaceae bacterium]